MQCDGRNVARKVTLNTERQTHHSYASKLASLCCKPAEASAYASPWFFENNSAQCGRAAVPSLRSVGSRRPMVLDCRGTCALSSGCSLAWPVPWSHAQCCACHMSHWQLNALRCAGVFHRQIQVTGGQPLDLQILGPVTAGCMRIADTPFWRGVRKGAPSYSARPRHMMLGLGRQDSTAQLYAKL